MGTYIHNGHGTIISASGEVVGEFGYCEDRDCCCSGLWSYWGEGISSEMLSEATEVASEVEYDALRAQARAR